MLAWGKKALLLHTGSKDAMARHKANPICSSATRIHALVLGSSGGEGREVLAPTFTRVDTMRTLGWAVIKTCLDSRPFFIL